MELSTDNIDSIEDLARALSASRTTPDFRNIDVDRVISEAQDSLLNTSMEAIRCDIPCSFNDILDDICEMNNNLELQKAAVAPSYYHMPDLGPSDYTPECSFSSQNDFLQPMGQWSEYLPMPPAALSNIQDIPQLAPIPTHPSPPPSQPNTPLKEPIDLMATNGNSNTMEPPKVDAQPAAPMQFYNNYHINIPSSMVMPPYIQQCMASVNSGQFPQTVENNINFMILPEPPETVPSNSRLGNQPKTFDWGRVVPRKPAEVVVLRPLRTRKVASSRASFDFSSYFDTSSISIPMIRERPRCKVNRRKQQLFTIPGSENLVFEVQLRSHAGATDLNNNADQLYPETEIPEVDEIFKRKRRGPNTKRNNPPPSEPPEIPLPSEHIEEAEDEMPTPTKCSDSYSDVDSDDAPLTIVKSMKCSKCRKLFKTCRSLTIHSKRCKATPRSPEPEKLRTIRKFSLQSGSSKENLDKVDEGGKLPEQALGTRPVTRSQTKRKAVVDDDTVRKRFK